MKDEGTKDLHRRRTLFVLFWDNDRCHKRTPWKRHHVTKILHDFAGFQHTLLVGIVDTGKDFVGALDVGTQLFSNCF
jgi:hypothetical protein